MVLKIKHHDQIVAEYPIRNLKELIAVARKFKGGLEAILLARGLQEGIKALIHHITTTGQLEAWFEHD